MPDATHASVASIRPITFTQPAKVAIGPGSSLQAAEDLAAQNATRVALFASRSTAALAAELIERLNDAGIETAISPSIPAEPTFEDAERARVWLRQQDADAVVAFGGGSVIDVAKVAAATARLEAPLSRFVGNGLIPERRLALFAIPTTAGAGSEASPNAIFLNREAKLKQGIISPRLVPDAAYIDPRLACSLPPAATAATALDALSHCVEAFANRNAHPLVDAYAVQGVRLIFEGLPAVLQDPRDLAARSALAVGSFYGGLSLGPVNTAAIHALSYPLGSEFGIPHGLANAILMPHVLRFNARAAPQRYAELADTLGLARDQDASERADAFIRALAALCHACPIERSLTQCGIPSSAIPNMAASALTIQRLLVNNVRELTQRDAELIYQNAFTE